MLKIYGYPSFNAIKALFAAEELGLDYEYQHIALGEGEQQSEAHLARNPLGRIPVLEHDGQFLIESAAICRYLSNISDKKLYSAEPLQAARIDQFMDTTTLHVGRWVGTFFWQEIVRKHIMGEEVDSAAIAEAQGFLDKQLPYYDATLSKHAYLCGDEFTLADVIAACYFQLKDATSFSFDEYANISRWYAQVAERPAFARANKRAEPPK